MHVCCIISLRKHCAYIDRQGRVRNALGPVFYRCNHACSGVWFFSPLVGAGAGYLSAGGAVGDDFADSATSERYSGDVYADGNGNGDYDRHAHQHGNGYGYAD